MGFSLKPRDDKFFDHLVAPAEKIVQATEVLSQMVESDHETNRHQVRKIDQLESAADQDQIATFRAIQNSFITPYDRDDLFNIATELENCMDLVNEAAEVILTINLDSYPSKVIKQLKYIRKSAEYTLDAMRNLKNINELREYWHEIKKLETKGDSIRRSVLTSLFTLEKDPIRLLKVKEIVEKLEDILNSMLLISRLTEAIAVNE